MSQAPRRPTVMRNIAYANQKGITGKEATDNYEATPKQAKRIMKKDPALNTLYKTVVNRNNQNLSTDQFGK